MTRPKVSVIVPAHNAERTILISTGSALNQTHDNVEVIVVDDGSTDTTWSLVTGHPDPRVKVVQQTQAGPSAARNRGIRESSGEYIAFLDDDDFLMPSYLETALSSLRSGKWFVTCNAYFMFPGGLSSRLVRHRGTIPRPDFQRLRLLESNWVSIMSVFPRSLLDDVDGFDVSLERAEDWDFWLRAVYAGWRVRHQSIPLAVFDRTSESQTSSVTRVARSERAIVSKMLERDDLSTQERHYLQARAAEEPPSILAHRCDEAIRVRKYREAAILARRAHALQPNNMPLRFKATALSIAPKTAGYAMRTRHEKRATSKLKPIEFEEFGSSWS